MAAWNDYRLRSRRVWRACVPLSLDAQRDEQAVEQRGETLLQRRRELADSIDHLRDICKRVQQLLGVEDGAGEPGEQLAEADARPHQQQRAGEQAVREQEGAPYEQLQQDEAVDEQQQQRQRAKRRAKRRRRRDRRRAEAEAKQAGARRQQRPGRSLDGRRRRKKRQRANRLRRRHAQLVDALALAQSVEQRTCDDLVTHAQGEAEVLRTALSWAAAAAGSSNEPELKAALCCADARWQRVQTLLDANLFQGPDPGDFGRAFSDTMERLGATSMGRLLDTDAVQQMVVKLRILRDMAQHVITTCSAAQRRSVWRRRAQRALELDPLWMTDLEERMGASAGDQRVQAPLRPQSLLHVKHIMRLYPGLDSGLWFGDGGITGEPKLCVC